MPDTPARKVQITARGLLLGERIDTQGLERTDVLATLPLMFRTGETGIVALFRFGVAVLFSMSPVQEEEIIRSLDGRIIGPFERREQETVQIEFVPDGDEQILPNGSITAKTVNDGARITYC